jgi:hypothetical protein
MSYDVLVGDKSYNYTYNLGNLFAEFLLPDATPKPGIYALDGMSGKEAAGFINEALEAIAYATRKAGGVGAMGSRYNAKNGWGDFHGAVMFLALIGSACAAKPKKKIRVI